MPPHDPTPTEISEHFFPSMAARSSKPDSKATCRKMRSTRRRT